MASIKAEPLPSPLPFLPAFHPATSSARFGLGTVLSPASASYHLRQVVAGVCLQRGFSGVQAGALEELESQAERYMRDLMEDVLLLARGAAGRRRPMLVDALEAVVHDSEYTGREEGMRRWKRGVGREARRQRTGNGLAPTPSNVHVPIPRSPPPPRTISLSDDEFDSPHLNIPFRPPAPMDFKPKVAPPSAPTPGGLWPEAAASGGASVPSTPGGVVGPAGFRLKLKMGAGAGGTPRPGMPFPSPSQGIATPSERRDAEPVDPAQAFTPPPKRKAENTLGPRKKSKEQRAAERKLVQESRVRMHDYGLKGVLPRVPPRHAVASGREGAGGAESARTGIKQEQPVALGQAETESTTAQGAASQDAIPTVSAKPPTKLDTQALLFLQTTLRERLDLKPDVGIVNYRRVDAAPAVRPYKAIAGGKGAKGTHVRRWKIRGMPVGR